jgi:hypothetical protein
VTGSFLYISKTTKPLSVQEVGVKRGHYRLEIYIEELDILLPRAHIHQRATGCPMDPAEHRLKAWGKKTYETVKFLPPGTLRTRRKKLWQIYITANNVSDYHWRGDLIHSPERE